ncbi:winged helix-turn-helix domain-containing protein [Candidatus Nitrosotenuis uzonensis]|uniref:ArnR1-like winged helix-turn-helix domain-containing protein n=1 Tax=Candidatus Nitrosotenuis uzonensis TaxID=1407055 RepID=A0A812ET98_9ARCH|nr:winged helix-turn-helix domain-containing protein [Candidatus Nitrosotenuis uzonensis]CAE6485762.1 conserved exported hypothetical protein [Candidatus Nitrosotenuis uzonensis]
MKSFVLLSAFVALLIFSSFLTVVSFYNAANNKPLYSLDTETVMVGQPTPVAYLELFLAQSNNLIIKNSLPLAVVCWAIVGSLIWRGHVKRLMLSSGLDYDVFSVMLKRRGGQTRLKILNELEFPKNRKQIAENLGFDWKAIDRHIKVLIKHQLINEIHQEGNAIYYMRTEKGRKFLDSFDNFTNSNQK